MFTSSLTGMTDCTNTPCPCEDKIKKANLQQPFKLVWLYSDTLGVIIWQAAASELGDGNKQLRVQRPARVTSTVTIITRVQMITDCETELPLDLTTDGQLLPNPFNIEKCKSIILAPC